MISAKRSYRQLISTFAVLAALASDPIAGLAATPASAAYSFAFKDADLSDVADAILGRSLNLPYSIDPELTAKITFRLDRRMTPAELLQAFETTLALQDIAVVKNGQTLVLEKRAKAKASSTVRTLEEGKHAVGYQTLSVPLTYASPQEIAKALQSVGAGSVVSYVDEAQNAIVLTGTAQEVDAAIQTIHMFDRKTDAAEKTRFFPLQMATPSGLAEDLNQLLHAAHVDGVNVVPMKRLNGVFAFARTSAGLDEVAKWVAKLDVAGEDRNGGLWIYHPHAASAESLKSALGGVLGLGGEDTEGSASTGAASSGAASRLSQDASRPSTGLSPQRSTSAPQSAAQSAEARGGTSGAIGISADGVRLGVDKVTNTLLISASAQQWHDIQRLLVELDRAPAQVLIEASILEVTLTKDNNFGVDFSVLSPSKHFNVGSSGNSGGTVGPSFPGFTINYADGNLKAAVNALSSNSKVEVVSAPKIITLDNKSATLDVGDQVPVVSQTSQSTVGDNSPLVSTVDYRNTGVILKVTPRITGADTILLDVSQEVSSVEPNTTSGIDSPTISQRHLDSTLIVQDGAVVALGGMISSNRSTGDTGIPFLKDAPWIGPLFRDSSNNLNRTELVVLLTARIIRDKAGADKAVSDMTTDMKALKADVPLHP